MTDSENAAAAAVEELLAELEGWSIVHDDTFSLRAKLSAALDALEDLNRRCGNGEDV